MALLTTFATTPITKLLYPPSYQKKLAAWRRGEIDWDTGEPVASDTVVTTDGREQKTGARIGQLLVYLKLDNLPETLNLISLFGKPVDAKVEDAAVDQVADQTVTGKEGLTAVAKSTSPQKAVRAHGLRLVELGDRVSSVMAVSEVDRYTSIDPVVNTFRTVGQFMRVAVSGEVFVMNEQIFAEALLAKATDISSDFILIPWVVPGHTGESQYETTLKSPYSSLAKPVLASRNQPVGVFVPQLTTSQHDHTRPSSSSQHGGKLSRAYSYSDIRRDIDLMPVTNKRHNIVLPFLGSTDDCFALDLVIQLCENPATTATIIHITEGSSTSHAQYLEQVASGLPESVASQIQFKDASAKDTSEAAVEQAAGAVRKSSRDVTWYNLVVVGRNDSARGTGSTVDEMQECFGRTASCMVKSKVKADVLIVQAKTV